MAIPPFIVALRSQVGHSLLWLSAATGVVLRGEGRDSDVLLVRRSDNGAWTPTAGIIDPGEEAHETAVREVLEETGVTCEVDDLRWSFSLPPMTYDNGDIAQYLELVFRCTWVSGDPYPADDESTEACWFPVTSLPRMSDQHRARIASCLAPAGPPWLGLATGLARADAVFAEFLRPIGSPAAGR